ncbi:MAG: hypothetical protein GY834_00960 [Bacteroidetes bacterium]|nr:hypothetical protein [Bacteroidota bacterium]
MNSSIKSIIKDSAIEKYARYIHSIVGRNFSKEFYAFYNCLFENELKSKDEIRNLQLNKMQEVCVKAYNYIDFYKKKFDDFDFHPSQLKTLEDIKKIPTLSKDEFRANPKALIYSNYRGRIHQSFTSGTSGTSLSVYGNKNVVDREWAAICYQWARVGYEPMDGRIEFRGFVKNNKDYIFVPNEKVIRINIIKLSEENIRRVVQKIRKSGYKYIHGYPSAIYKFYKLLSSINQLPEPVGILFSSEVIYDWQYDFINELVPHSKKICHYGSVEKVAIGAWTEERKYSFIPTYGLVEADEVTDEIIGTGFINDVMPLIRYKLKDSVAGFTEVPLNNRRTLFPVISKISGRLEDLTYTTNGVMIPPAIVTFPFKNLLHLQACKLIQNNITNFELLVEAFEDSNSKKEAYDVRDKLLTVYGHDAKISISFVNKIQPEKSGKFRWIECKFQPL